MLMTISYQSTSKLEEKVKNLFKQVNMASEYSRAMIVRSLALKIASQYGLDNTQVTTAALLHNISLIIPENKYLKIAEEYGIEIFPEERNNPYLLHQKISRILAVTEFNICDKEVLNAIACHTTLRPSATLLDKIIFFASKQNNQQAKKITFNNINTSSEQDLNNYIFSYLFNKTNQESISQSIHPWARKTIEELKPK